MEDALLQPEAAMAALLATCVLIALEKIAGLCLIKLSLSAASSPSLGPLLFFFLLVHNKAGLISPCCVLSLPPFRQLKGNC